MKKLLIFAISSIFGLHALAQNPVKFGIKAGITLPHMTVSVLGASFSFDSRTSFYVGGTADIAISDVVAIQPGLSLVNKGTKIQGELFDFEDSSSESGSINLMYLEIPLNLLAKLKVGNAGKVFFGAGPYYAIGIDASTKYGNVKEDVNFGAGDENIKRGEFGFNFLGGYQLNNGLNLHLGYGLGISSVIPDQEYNVKFKNRVFSFGLGYTF